MTDRIEISNVFAVDWSKAGPIFAIRGEDGFDISAPKMEWVVQATTARGEVFNFLIAFAHHDEALHFVSRVLARGSIDPDLWALYRTIYGSEAFEAEESDAALYAASIRNGWLREEDAPDHIRTML